MTNFISSFFKEQEGIKKFKEKLATLISDKKLSEQQKSELDKIIAEYKLSDKKLISAKKDAFISLYNALTKDGRLPQYKIDILSDLLSYFKLDINQVGIDLNQFRKFINLALIDDNILPNVTSAEHDLNIIYKPDEILHYRSHSLLRKMKHVTTAIQYKGLTASVRIVKGVRYRAGNLKIGRNTTDVLTVEDRGIFYITNYQIGYHGQQKQFSILHEKISALELRSDGLYIFKQGKESPYIVTLDDYEVPLAMESFLLNKKEENKHQSSGMGMNFKTPAIEEYLKNHPEEK